MKFALLWKIVIVLVLSAFTFVDMNVVDIKPATTKPQCPEGYKWVIRKGNCTKIAKKY